MTEQVRGATREPQRSPVAKSRDRRAFRQRAIVPALLDQLCESRAVVDARTHTRHACLCLYGPLEFTSVHRSRSELMTTRSVA